MSILDPRMMTALNLLPAKSREFYLRHGHIMAIYALNATQTAARFPGFHRKDIARAVDFARVWGAPPAEVAPQKQVDEDRGALVIVFPDMHAQPADQMNDYSRFRRAGRYARRLILQAKRRNQRVVVANLGDFGDVYSLCFWEKDRAGFDQGNVHADIECMQNALLAFHEALGDEANEWVGRKVYTIGNHEHRLDKAAKRKDSRRFMLNLPDYRTPWRELGWEVYDFMMPANVDGLAIAHCFPSGNSGKPFGGERYAARMLAKNGASSICGHSHVYDEAHDTNIFGEKRFAVVGGVWVDGAPDFAKNTYHKWDIGVTVIDGLKNGSAEAVSFHRMPAVIRAVGE